MTKDQLRALLTASQVDFKEAVPRATTGVLTALRADLVAEGSNYLTNFGIRIIDRELSTRA